MYILIRSFYCCFILTRALDLLTPGRHQRILLKPIHAASIGRRSKPWAATPGTHWVFCHIRDVSIERRRAWPLCDL